MKPVKKWVKIALDAVLFLLLILMYRKQAISLSFHEIGGLALIGLFILHHIFNGKWITAVTRRLFSKELPVRTRVGYAVDALLLLAFLSIGVSGALISKTVFSFRAGGGWKTLHYFSAALAVILSGVHIGLHAEYLFGFLRKRGRLLRITATVLLAAFVCFGLYNAVSTSFSRWLSMPFAAAQLAERGDGAHEGPGQPGQGGGQGNGPRDGSGYGKGQGQHGGGGSVAAALTVAAQFASITAVFAALTYAAERLLRQIKRPPVHE